MNQKSLIIIFLLVLPALSFSKTVLFLGDSLTEGYKLPQENSYPSLIQKKFQADGVDIKVINGGVSGSTTADGLNRLKWYMKKSPDFMVLALGANDGLRGLKIEKTKQNLLNIIKHAQDKGVKVLLVGMLMPPNFGPEYTKSFKDMYIQIKDEMKTPFLPFILKGVAGVKELNLEDGIHPNKKGYQIIAKEVYSFIKDNL
jgi:acyl-CoA thioesterase-1